MDTMRRMIRGIEGMGRIMISLGIMIALMGGCHDPDTEHDPVHGSPHPLELEVTSWRCDDAGRLTVDVELVGSGRVVCAPCEGAPEAVDGAWQGELACGRMDPVTTILTCEGEDGQLAWVPLVEVAGDLRGCEGHVASPSGR